MLAKKAISEISQYLEIMPKILTSMEIEGIIGNRWLVGNRSADELEQLNTLPA
jgi:hypothetical protein